MESLEELTKSTNGKPGFFKHVFNFNDESKNDHHDEDVEPQETAKVRHDELPRCTEA